MREEYFLSYSGHYKKEFMSSMDVSDCVGHELFSKNEKMSRVGL